MKPSQVAVLSAGGVLAGIVVLMVASLEQATWSRGDWRVFNRDQISANPGLAEFSEIEAAGAWQISVTQGDQWQIALSYPDGLEEKPRVSLQGDRLILGSAPHYASWIGSGPRPIADIVMPELELLKLKGNCQLEMSGFHGNRLEIDGVGAIRILGREGRYDSLSLVLAGAGKINLSEIPVTAAEVDLAGASDIVLSMNGGELSGSISGAGSLEYYGQVSGITVDIAGAARVVHAR